MLKVPTPQPPQPTSPLCPPPKIVIWSFVDNFVKRGQHLATRMTSLNCACVTCVRNDKSTMGMYSICDMKWTYDAASCPECTKIANRGGPLEAAWAKAKMSLPLGNLIWFYKFIYITYINGPRLPRCFLWRIDHPSSSSSSSPIQISHPWPELSYCPTLQQAWNLPLAAPARIASEIRAWGPTDNSWAPTLSPVKRRGRTLFRELFF